MTSAATVGETGTLRTTEGVAMAAGEAMGACKPTWVAMGGEVTRLDRRAAMASRAGAAGVEAGARRAGATAGGAGVRRCTAGAWARGARAASGVSPCAPGGWRRCRRRSGGARCGRASRRLAGVRGRGGRGGGGRPLLGTLSDGWIRTCWDHGSVIGTSRAISAPSDQCVVVVIGRGLAGAQRGPFMVRERVRGWRVGERAEGAEGGWYAVRE